MPQQQKNIWNWNTNGSAQPTTLSQSHKDTLLSPQTQEQSLSSNKNVGEGWSWNTATSTQESKEQDELLNLPILGHAEGLVKGALGFAFGGSVSTVAGAKKYFDEDKDLVEGFKMYEHIMQDLIESDPGDILFVPETKQGKQVLEWFHDYFSFMQEKVWKPRADNLYNEMINRGADPEKAAYQAAKVRGLGEVVSMAPIIIGVRAAGKWSGAVLKHMNKPRPQKKEGINLLDKKIERPKTVELEGDVPPLSFRVFKETLKKDNPKLSDEAIRAQWDNILDSVRYTLEDKAPKGSRPISYDVAVEGKYNLAGPEVIRPGMPRLEFIKDGPLPYGMYRIVHGKAKRTGKSVSEKTIQNHYTKYINSFLPDGFLMPLGKGQKVRPGVGVLAKDFNDAVVRGRMLHEMRKIGKQVKNRNRIDRKQRGAIDPDMPREIAKAIFNRLRPAIKGMESEGVDWGANTPHYILRKEARMSGIKEELVDGFFDPKERHFYSRSETEQIIAKTTKRKAQEGEAETVNIGQMQQNMKAYPELFDIGKKQRGAVSLDKLFRSAAKKSRAFEGFLESIIAAAEVSHGAELTLRANPKSVFRGVNKNLAKWLDLEGKILTYRKNLGRAPTKEEQADLIRLRSKVLPQLRAFYKSVKEGKTPDVSFMGKLRTVPEIKREVFEQAERMAKKHEEIDKRILKAAADAVKIDKIPTYFSNRLANYKSSVPWITEQGQHQIGRLTGKWAKDPETGEYIYWANRNGQLQLVKESNILRATQETAMITGNKQALNVVKNLRDAADLTGPRGIVAGRDYPWLDRANKQRGSIDVQEIANEIAKGVKNIDEFRNEFLSRVGPSYSPIVEQLYKASQQAEKSKHGLAMIKNTDNPSGAFITTARRHPLGSFIEFVGGKSLAHLWSKRPYSQTWSQIVDNIHVPDKYLGPSTVSQSFHQAKMLRIGEFMGEIDAIYQKYLPNWLPYIRNGIPRAVGGYAGRKVSPALNKQLRAVLSGDRSVRVSSKALKMAGEIREVLDRIHEYIRTSDVSMEELGYLKNYLHRIYDVKKIKKNREEFADILLSEMLKQRKKDFYTARELESLKADIEDIIDNIVHNEGVIDLAARNPTQVKDIRRIVLFGQGIARASGIDYARRLKNIDDVALKDFLKDSVYERLTKYVEDSVSRAEYARRYGSNNEKLYTMVNQAAKELHQAGKPLTYHEVRKLFDLLEAMQHIYKSDIHPFWRKVNTGTITVLNASLLQLATISSFPEMLVPMYAGGVRAYVKAMPELAKTVTLQIGQQIYKDFKINGMSKTEMMKVAEDIRKAGSVAAMERMDALFAGDFTAFGSVVFRANFLYYWTKAMNQLAVGTYKNLVRDYYMNLAKGKGIKGLSKAEMERTEALMQYYGLNKAEGIEWAKSGAKLEGPFYEKMKAGAVTFAEDSVLAPNPSSVPLWHSNPRFAIFRHLKTFPSLIGTKVLKRWITDVTSEIRKEHWYNASSNLTRGLIGTGAGMLLIAHLANIIQDQIRYGGENPLYTRQFEKKFERNLIRAVERAGMMGMGNFLFDALFHSHYSGPAGTLAGPAVSRGSEWAHAMTQAVNGKSRPISKEIIKTFVPIGNIRQSTRDKLTDNLSKWIAEHTSLEHVPKDSKGRKARQARSARSAL